MVEVFKTNVNEREWAIVLVEIIHKNFSGYKANFDLSDCDKILRIECTVEKINAGLIIKLVTDHGYNAEILPDEISPVKQIRGHSIFKSAV